MAEKSGVWRPAANDPAGTNSSSGELLLKGAPYRVSGSISAGKEQMLMQVGAARGFLLGWCRAIWLTCRNWFAIAARHLVQLVGDHACLVICLLFVVVLQTRGDVSVYHDLAGLASTTLSADMQTSGAGGKGHGWTCSTSKMLP